MGLSVHLRSFFDLIPFYDVPFNLSSVNELQLLLKLRLSVKNEKVFNVICCSKRGIHLTLEERIHIYRHLLYQDIDSVTYCVNSRQCVEMWNKLGIVGKEPDVVY